MAELRQHRLALPKLLVDLALPAETVAELARPSAATRQASHAATARWGRAKRLGA